MKYLSEENKKHFVDSFSQYIHTIPFNVVYRLDGMCYLKFVIFVVVNLLPTVLSNIVKQRNIKEAS